MVATGTFEVARGRLDATSPLERHSLKKRFAGDLTAEGTGEMLSWVGGTEGGAVYVALERVEGTLDDAKGSFLLAHHGTMSNEGQQLSVLVVPHSGTGDFAGIMGTMSIRIDDGIHRYELRYQIPERGASGYSR